MIAVDSSQFPRVARYLAAVPNGLESHPQCKTTVALARHFLEARPMPEEGAAGLPPEVARVITAKLPVSSWIEEVKVVAALLAMADYHRMSDAEWVAFNRQENVRFLGGKFFKVLMSVASPKLLIMGAQLRWGAFRQGTKLEVEKKTEQSWEVRLLHPVELFPQVQLLAIGTGFEAALQLSNAKTAKVEFVRSEPERTIYRAEWT